MQMLRELGFLNESSPEADALARSSSQLTTTQAGAAYGSVELQAAGTAGADMAEANSGIPSPQQGVVKGATGQKTDEDR